MNKYRAYIKYLLENHTINKVLIESGYSLFEAVELSPKILDVLQKYGYKEPTTDKYKKIGLTDKPGLFRVIDDRDKSIETKKIGQILKSLYPNIDIVGDKTVTALMSDLKVLFSGESLPAKFEISDQISYWYKKLEKDKEIGSCVNISGCSDKLLEAFDNDSNIQIVIIRNKETNEPMGRALLWTGVDGLDAPYLDRTYPGDVSDIHAMYIQWAKSKGYYYRDGMGHGGYGVISGQNRIIKYNFSLKPYYDIKALPYMDTFRFGYIDQEGNLVGSNHKTKENLFVFDNSKGFIFEKPKKLWNQMSQEEKLEELKELAKNNSLDDNLAQQLSLDELNFYIKKNMENNNGALDLRDLTSLPNNFKFPESIGGFLSLKGLTSLPDGIRFPEKIGALDLNSLTYLPNNITFPETINKSLYLSNLTSLPDNFKFPKNIGGSLNLDSLKEIPQEVWDNMSEQVKSKVPDNLKRSN